MFKLKKLGLFRKTPNRYYVQKSKESDTKITVDSELSITSENPVQNKTLSQILNEIQEKLNRKRYLHIISLYDRSSLAAITMFDVLNTEDKINTLDKLKNYLLSQGYTSSNKSPNILTPSTVFEKMFPYIGTPFQSNSVNQKIIKSIYLSGNSVIVTGDMFSTTLRTDENNKVVVDVQGGPGFGNTILFVEGQNDLTDVVIEL